MNLLSSKLMSPKTTDIVNFAEFFCFKLEIWLGGYEAPRILFQSTLVAESQMESRC